MGVEIRKEKEYLVIRGKVEGCDGMPLGNVNVDDVTVEFAGWQKSLSFTSQEWVVVRNWIDAQLSKAIVSYPGKGTGEAYDRSGK